MKVFKPILDIKKTANDYDLADNCYYCTAAALCNATVDDFFRKSEIMQEKGGVESLDDIISLFAEAGVKDICYEKVTGDDLNDLENRMPEYSGIGLAYETKTNKHVVVFAKFPDGKARLVDYQADPPTISESLPSNCINVYVIY